jgi:hypothetical protein
MSKPVPRRDDSTQSEPEEPSQGPNLILIYTLLVLGLLAAAGIAAMVVWPFYVRR